MIKPCVIVGAQLSWSGRANVTSYTEINKAVSQKLLTLNLCISVRWLLTSAFYISCPHTPEIIDMHRGVCDKLQE